MTEQSKFFEGLLQQETFFLESQDGFGLKYNIPNFFICFGLPSVILSQWMMISYLALLLIIPCHSLTVCHLMRRRLPRKLVEIHIKFNGDFSNCPKQQKTRPIDKYLYTLPTNTHILHLISIRHHGIMCHPSKSFSVQCSLLSEKNLFTIGCIELSIDIPVWAYFWSFLNSKRGK